jgi:asparagine synthase (glutamine-hydrolysing)
LAIGLPLRWKLRGRRGQWLLRQAFGHLLPREVFHRRKTGFGVPLDQWFRGPLGNLARDTLLSQQARERGYFRREAIEALVTEHASARHDHSARLWSLLMLELWHREWVDAGPTGD